MPFSRASAVIASRISRDMWLLLHQVRTRDVGVRDGDDAAVGGDRHGVVGGADELPREALVTVVVAARAHTGALADEATEVLRLGERPPRPGARDLERVALADL